MRHTSMTLGVVMAAILAVSACAAPAVDESESPAAEIAGAEDGVPILEYDPTWPKRPMANAAIFGAVMAIDVDSEDNIWVMHWNHWLGQTDNSATMGRGECCNPLPFVTKFNQEGDLLNSWGDVEDPALMAPGFQWVVARGGAHGIYVDYAGNVWTGSHTPGASYENAYANLAKFTNDGTFIMQKGTFGQSKGNADTDNFAQPTGIVVDEATNEAFIADGYDNRRVIVIDADTMEYKRMWGAYGNEPMDGPLPARPDGEPSPQFTGVHCIKMSNDGLLYVCDRPNNRVQVFQKDGTFVSEGFVGKATDGGTVADVAFSADADQRYLYVGDGVNRKVWILRRDTLETVGSFGNGGNYGGEFAYIHTVATDSKGNVYVGEHSNGHRAQRFTITGFE